MNSATIRLFSAPTAFFNPISLRRSITIAIIVIVLVAVLVRELTKGGRP